MSQQASVTLNSIVYSPAGADKGILKWANRAGGILNSFSSLTQRFLAGAGDRKLTKVTYRVVVPVVATEDSTCACAGTVLRENSFQFDYWIDANATAAERADIVARAISLAGSTLVSDGVGSLDPAYA